MSKLLIGTRRSQNNKIFQNFSVLQLKKIQALLPQIHSYVQQEPWNANVIRQQAGRLLFFIFLSRKQERVCSIDAVGGGGE